MFATQVAIDDSIAIPFRTLVKSARKMTPVTNETPPAVRYYNNRVSMKKKWSEGTTRRAFRARGSVFYDAKINHCRINHACHGNTVLVEPHLRR